MAVAYLFEATVMASKVGFSVIYVWDVLRYGGRPLIEQRPEFIAYLLLEVWLSSIPWCRRHLGRPHIDRGLRLVD
jgi:hypothetical protein